MIVIANEELALGLRIAGIKDSFCVRTKEDAENILKTIDPDEFMIVTNKIIEMIPKLKDYPNLISFPDKLSDFSNISDLKYITKIAIGSEVEL